MHNRWMVVSGCLAVALLSACGGGSSDSMSGGGPAAMAPAITTQPGNVATTVGNAASFTVVASGTPPLTYQWQRNGTAITGATMGSYTASAVQLADDGAMFSVVVSNSIGSVTSDSAKLSVTPASGNGSPSAGDVVTFKNDIGRTGQYLVETALTPATVSSGSFGLLRQLMVDGKVDAQPLYLSQLTVGNAVHNVVFIATENASVYAFDADSGNQLWKVSLLAPGETPSDTHSCGQVDPKIGITATPVIDRTAGPDGTIYVVAMSIDSTAKYHQRLHALDVTSGTELLNGPTEITATFPISGGVTTFAPGQYEERAALLLTGGTIYTAWTSHCDQPPYSGWVIAFDQATLSQAAALNVAPQSGPTPLPGVPSGDSTSYSTNGPAIWMAGDGPAADAAGNIYFLTGNGRFETTLDANGFPNQGDYGNSFVKASKSGGSMTVADYFATFDAAHLSAQDLDLGSGGEMLLPDLMDSTNTVKHLVVGAGKDGNIYLVDRDNMGKFDSARNNIWQQVSSQLGGQVFSSPAYFNGNLYYAATGATLRAFSVTGAKLSTTPTSRSGAAFAYPGASPAISANGTANGIVWAHSNGTPAVLYAFDASDLSHELYDSNQATGSRDHFGAGNKFITPMIAGGKVFVGTTNSVAVFGLLH